MMRVKFNFGCAAVAARRTNNSVHPLMMGATAILASGILTIVWMIFSAVSEPAFISARLRTEFSILKRGDRLSSDMKGVPAMLAGLRPFTT
jgi:hypothetical protein